MWWLGCCVCRVGLVWWVMYIWYMCWVGFVLLFLVCLWWICVVVYIGMCDSMCCSCGIGWLGSWCLFLWIWVGVLLLERLCKIFCSSGMYCRFVFGVWFLFCGWWWVWCGLWWCCLCVLMVDWWVWVCGCCECVF